MNNTRRTYRRETLSEIIQDGIKVAFWMLFFVFSLAFSMSFLSCDTTKKSSKKTQDYEYSKDSMNLSISQLRGFQMWDVSSWIQRSEVDNTYKIVVYDTSKPVDPETKRPPVLSDIEILSNATTTTQSSDSLHATDTTSVVIISDSTSVRQSEHNEKIVEQKSTNTSTNLWMWIVSTVCVAFLIIGILKRLRIL